MKDISLLIILIAGITYTVGDIFAKYWIKTSKSFYFVSIIFFFMIASIFLAYSFKYKNIAVASLIVTLFNIAILTLISWFYFKERLSSLELFGLGLGMTSIIILELAHNN